MTRFFTSSDFFDTVHLLRSVQLPNPGFENWESNGEPTGFHSFNSVSGSFAGTASTKDQLSQQNEKTEDGKTCLQIAE